jgi:hypothetical protein
MAERKCRRSPGNSQIRRRLGRTGCKERYFHHNIIVYKGSHGICAKERNKDSPDRRGAAGAVYDRLQPRRHASANL